MILPGDTTNIALNCKLRLLPGHFWFLKLLSQQAKKEITLLRGVIDPDYQEGNWTVTPQWRYGRLCLEGRRFLTVSFGTATSCD